MVVSHEVEGIGTSHIMNHRANHRKEPGLYPEEYRHEMIHGRGRNHRMY